MEECSPTMTTPPKEEPIGVVASAKKGQILKTNQKRIMEANISKNLSKINSQLEVISNQLETSSAPEHYSNYVNSLQSQINVFDTLLKNSVNKI